MLSANPGGYQPTRTACIGWRAVPGRSRLPIAPREQVRIAREDRHERVERRARLLLDFHREQKRLPVGRERSTARNERSQRCEVERLEAPVLRGSAPFMAELKHAVDEEHVGLRALIAEREGIVQRMRVQVVVVRVRGQPAARAVRLVRQLCAYRGHRKREREE